MEVYFDAEESFSGGGKRRRLPPHASSRSRAKENRYSGGDRVPRVTCKHDRASCRADALTQRDVAHINAQLYRTRDKVQQDAILLSHIEVMTCKRRRPKVQSEEKQRHRDLTIKYTVVKEDDTTVPVCQASFLSIFGVNKDRVQGIAKYWLENGRARPENRGGSRQKDEDATRRETHRADVPPTAQGRDPTATDASVWTPTVPEWMRFEPEPLNSSRSAPDTTSVTVKIESQEDVHPTCESEEEVDKRLAADVCPWREPEEEAGPRAQEQLGRLRRVNADLLEELESQKRLIWSLRCTPEALHYCGVPNYFSFCTGFTYQQFNSLCGVFGISDSAAVTSRQQLLLVLMKLRQDFDFKDLAFRFQMGVESVCTVFASWIPQMFSKFSVGTTWPHREVISELMPDTFRTTLALLGFVELATEGSETLKGLVAVDARGAVLYVSRLFTGPITELEVFRRSSIVPLLKTLLHRGHLRKGDTLTADGQLQGDLEELGLRWAESKEQTGKSLVARVVHKIKTFKIVSGSIPNSMRSNVSEIWFVVSMLANFQSGHH